MHREGWNGKASIPYDEVKSSKNFSIGGSCGEDSKEGKTYGVDDIEKFYSLCSYYNFQGKKKKLYHKRIDSFDDFK